MITLLHLAWNGGCPHLLLYSLETSALVMELPLSKERAQTVMAKGGKLHADSPRSIPVR